MRIEHMTKPTVLYLSYDGLTDPLGQSQILPYLCGLADGYDIHIISFEKPNQYQVDKKPIETLCKKYSLSWHPLQYHKNPPIFSTVYDLTVLWLTAKRLHERFGFSIVHCRSYLTALTGLQLKKRYGIKFIFDMRGFWADERVEGGIWKMNNPLYRIIYNFFKRKESEFLKCSDHTVTLTHAAHKFITGNFPAGPISVIPCCVDTDFFNPENYPKESRDVLREQTGLTADDYVLGYVGSLGTWYMYDEMVEFFNLLKREIPRAKMLLLTPDKHKVSERDDFKVLTVSRTDMPAYISLFNASVCFIKPTFSKSGSSATKIAEVLSMGVPIVVNAGWGDISTMPAFSKAGVIVETVDQPNLLKAVHVLKSLPLSADVIRATSVGYFSLTSGINKYRQIYDRLTA
jgi:glycosyltransferase involved in cell wall biosynthesis